VSGLGEDGLAIDAGMEKQLVPAADGVRLFVPHARLQGRLVIQRRSVDWHRRAHRVIEDEVAIGPGNSGDDGARGNDRWAYGPRSGELPTHRSISFTAESDIITLFVFAFSSLEFVLNGFTDECSHPPLADERLARSSVSFWSRMTVAFSFCSGFSSGRPMRPELNDIGKFIKGAVSFLHPIECGMLPVL
jgi:hypothetical protein